MVRLPVRCLAVAADGSASLMMVRSVDLSAGGVCVVTDRPLDPGDRVRLAFEVADGTPFKLEGHVARAERLRDGMRRYGLEFAELDLATEQRMFKAVFEQEQVNVGRHAHVRMTVWEPVTCHARRRAATGSRPTRSSSRPTTCRSSPAVRSRRRAGAGRDGRRGPRVPDRRRCRGGRSAARPPRLATWRRSRSTASTA